MSLRLLRQKKRAKALGLKPYESTSPFGLTGWAVWLRGRYLGEAWGHEMTADEAIADPLFGIALHHRHYGQAVRVEDLEQAPEKPDPPEDEWGHKRSIFPNYFDSFRKTPEQMAEEAAAEQRRRAEQDEDERRLLTARKTTAPEKVAWVQYMRDYCPGRWHAYGATRYGLGFVKPDGSWEWHARDEDSGLDQARGVEGSVEAAKRVIERLWQESLKLQPKPMTEAQIVANYRRGLLSKIRNYDPELPSRATRAIATLEKCGWLDKCPVLDEDLARALSDRLIFKLRKLGKIEPQEDIFP